MSDPPRQPPRHRRIDASPAFRHAALRSEIRRAYVVIGVMLLLELMITRADSVSNMDWRVILASAIGVGSIIIVQCVILLLARHAARTGRSIPFWFILTTAVIECLVPTAIIMIAFASGALSPYAAMSAPPLLAYGTMICLMVLRLRPWLCVLAGAVCALSYLGTLAYITVGLGIDTPTTGLPRVAYINSASMIFIGGLAAAWVAHEFRLHVEAALNEAEARRRIAMIEQDIAVARSIQQAILPHEPPDIPGYDIAGWNRPADQTGGDYYDWQRLPDGNWIITLADVSGHGVGPAMVTAACRAYVRATSSHHPDLPALITHVNHLLAQDLPDGRFVTMASVLLTPGSNALGLLSAGHGPIVLYVGAQGSVQDIMPRDVPLAVIPDTAFGPAQVVELARGDVLALITDGFVEWSRPTATKAREQFGIQRLHESLRRHSALPAAAMIDAIAADVAAFAGDEPQQDDLTIVIIRRTA
ncbi:MAG: SpoIIE family protein phosphatase [Phycisphaeraceae bacterium]|nr:SpoIIE family protein phosphatase [Phycisphaeraceae bacterium]